MPLVSIICPVYNAERYLKNTLDSILAQSHQKIELILMDDGSTDRSLAICRQYANRDPRVKVYHTENRGAARARNFALEKTTGEYIAFVDSDDLIKETFIEQMVKTAIQTGEQIVVCKNRRGNEWTSETFMAYVPQENPKIETVDFSRYRYSNRYSYAVVWGALFRSSLIHDLAFDPELYIGEDTFFFACALNRVKSLVWVDEYYYYYAIREDSVFHQSFNRKREAEFRAWEKVAELYSAESSEFQNEIKVRQLQTYMTNYGQAKQAGYQNKESVKEMLKKVKLYSPCAMRSRELSFKSKLFIRMFTTVPDFAIYVKSFRDRIRANKEIAQVRERKEMENMQPVPVVFAMDERYIVPAFIAIKSLVCHADRKRQYKIWILTDTEQENDLKEMFRTLNRENAEIRFICVGERMGRVNLSWLGGSFNQQATFYRLLIPELFPEYDKVIYLDADIVVLDDVAKLYEQDVEGSCLGGVKEIMPFEPDGISLCQELKIPNLDSYINAGVLLMNLKELRNSGINKRMVQLAREKQFPYNDQDILNSCCYGHIKRLPTSFNVFPRDLVDWQQLKKQKNVNYKALVKDPLIIHYLSEWKPWLSRRLPYAKYWWAQVDRRSPYYASKIKPFLQEAKKKVSRKKMERYLLDCYLKGHPFISLLIKKLIRKCRRAMHELLSYIRVKKEYNKKTDITENPDEIVLLDTSIQSDNIGDDIIMHFIWKNLEPYFSGYSLYRVATHTFPSDEDIRHMLSAKMAVFCGTNIVSSHLEYGSNWRFDKRCIHMKNVLMVAVGCDSCARPSRCSEFVYRYITENNFCQSVRDTQCADLLRKCGVKNIVNTGCLTCWGLDEVAVNIPKSKSENVIFSLTGYYKNEKKDQELLKILRRHYKILYFWPQGDQDEEYLKRIDDLHNVCFIHRSLEAYTLFLKENRYDYIGSRLHGGIYAMHHCHRTIILAVDHRAIEMGRDINLPVLRLEDCGSQLKGMIEGCWETIIRLDHDAIDRWKKSLDGIRKNG